MGEDVYVQLKKAADRVGKPATELAREAIEDALVALRKAELDTAIAGYAAETAGSSDDLDLDLERAAVDHMVERARKR